MLTPFGKKNLLFIPSLILHPANDISFRLITNPTPKGSQKNCRSLMGIRKIQLHKILYQKSSKGFFNIVQTNIFYQKIQAPSKFIYFTNNRSLFQVNSLAIPRLEKSKQSQIFGKLKILKFWKTEIILANYFVHFRFFLGWSDLIRIKCPRILIEIVTMVNIQEKKQH